MKPTHADQYLQWDSHHRLSSKYSVIGTLAHRAKVVCTNSELLQDELNHLRRALGKCNYPTWAIKKVQHKVLNNNQEDTSKTIQSTSTTQAITTMAIQTSTNKPAIQPTTDKQTRPQ